MTVITLFIPGLLTPARELLESDIPPTPALKKLLRIARRRKFTSQGFSRTICRFFNLPEPEQDDPIGAITHLVDDQVTPGELWMRADPVHLAADREGVVLMDHSCFNLERQEALILAADIRELLSEYGMQLEVPDTCRWYLKLREPPEITTTPIHEVVARNIHRHLPTGARGDEWVRLLNEIQMTLHNSNVNETRQKQGELPINSIWCWGSGELPGSVACPWDRVYSDEIIAEGLAQAAGTEFLELPETGTDLLSGRVNKHNILGILSAGLRHWQYQDLRGWQDFIDYLETYWFSPLLQAVQQGAVGELVLVLEDQRFQVRKSSLLKFWKQPKPLPSYIS